MEPKEIELVALVKGTANNVIPEVRLQKKAEGTTQNPTPRKSVVLLVGLVLLLITMYYAPAPSRAGSLSFPQPPPTDKEPILNPQNEEGSTEGTSSPTKNNVGSMAPSSFEPTKSPVLLGTSPPSENSDTSAAPTTFPDENSDCIGRFPGRNAGSMGSACAPMALVMYHDFQCPGSKKAYEFFQENLINKGYAEQGCVSFSLRDVTDNKKHPNAFEAAKASRCAGKQGLYWEMSTMIYSKQSNLAWVSSSEDDIEILFQDWFSNISTSVTPNVDSFASCMKNDLYMRHRIEDQFFTDPILWKLEWTPYFAINEEPIREMSRPYKDILHDVIRNCSL